MPKKKFKQPYVDSNTVAELSKKLLEANSRLKEAENERRIMLENISHDLRAPLTAMRSTIDLLKERSSDGKFSYSSKETDELLSILDRRSQNLEELVQNLYFLTKLENGSERLNFEKVPVDFFLEDYFFSTDIDDKYKERELELKIQENSDVMIYIDVNKFTRVLDNLFTNALKYSEKGASIILGASYFEDKVAIFVKDTGIGIPDDAIEHVFERTYRVSKARTPSTASGSGLGLSIAQNIILQHGGNIYCESTLGEGSTFTIELPIVKE